MTTNPSIEKRDDSRIALVCHWALAQSYEYGGHVLEDGPEAEVARRKCEKPEEYNGWLIHEMR